MKKSWPAWAALLLAAVAAAAPAPPASAQGGASGKPFGQWTKSEAEQVLIESPWAQTVAPGGGAISLGGLNRVSTPDKALTIRLRSALPVRQAMLRLRQLHEKYDQMSDAKKAEFDQKNGPLMECPACADHYVVALLPPPGGRVTLPHALLRTAPEKVKLYVHLADERGTRREAVHYLPPKSQSGEAVFFFPRFDGKGAPLLTPASRKLVFTIGPEILEGETRLSRFEFDVSKMLVDGRVEF
jgi:hypothetical protein